ncbi:MAG: hypothetical protein RIS17_1178 [Pseudomonadota bacterium]|jgi:putative flippase GtrA
MRGLATRQGLAQFLRFGVVGVANTALTTGLVWLLAPHVGVTAASVLGYAAGVVQSFLVNRFWTFGATRTGGAGRWQGEALRFIAVNLACGALFTSVTTIGEPMIGLLPATLAGVALVTPLGFILNRFVVFR